MFKSKIKAHLFAKYNSYYKYSNNAEYAWLHISCFQTIYSFNL